MMNIPGLTNSGSMPINAGGGAAGPSGVHSQNESALRVGGISMGGGSLPIWLLFAIGATALWLLIKGGR
ncbi:hypothetical protein [Photobacterium rosenbergii]|uniref:Uncharacterized protein n=1 Tax=Photobacterium rosenbergii TaxID=294936 RepID=A0ABU3ZBM7_9GAMM|nr:hypothetical protein [Photobacterium rosenbergii]MDV5167510.1 hypothetical protein [Photobacterium rosenbergii]